MAGTVLLVGAGAGSVEGIPSGVAVATNDALEQVDGLDEALARLERAEHGVDALVLPADLEAPLDAAQRAHALDSDLAILILAPPDQCVRLAKALQFAPFIGEDVTCLATADPGIVPLAVRDAVARTRKRRELRSAASSDRLPAPAALEAPAEQYLGQLLERAPVGVVVVDATGALIGWNRRAGEILGESERDIVGEPLAGLFDEADATRLDDLLSRALAADGRTPSELLERSAPDGGPQFVELTAAPLTGRAGEPGVMLLVQDVTDRVLAEEERRWMEEALRFQKTLLESQSESSMEATLVVSREGTVLSVNRRFCELWGIPDAGVAMRSARAARAAFEERIAAPPGFGARFASLSPSADEASRDDILLKDGRLLATYSGPVKTADGLHYGRVWFFRDITDVKRAEEELEMRAREQAAVAWLGQRALKTESVQTLMDEALALLADTLGVEYANVLELAPEGDRLLLRAGVGWEEGLVGSATVGAGTESQAGYTLRAGVPVVVEDLRTEQRFSGPSLLHEHDVVSGMSITIEGRDPVFGVLGIHATQPRRFSEDDINFVRSIANVLSAAIEGTDADAERARLLELEQEARAAAESANTVVQQVEAVTEAALAHIELEDLLLELLGRIASVLNADTAAILLMDEERDELVARVAKGLEDEVKAGFRVPVGKGFAGRIAAERRPVFIRDIDRAEVLNPLFREKGIRSLLGVPLLVEGAVTGVLHVGTREEREFTDEDVRVLRLVADRVALAIDQARLYEAERAARSEAQAAQARVEFLAEVTELLAESLDYESTLGRIARLAVPTLADWCIVDEVREDGQVASVAVAAASERKQELLEELRERYPPDSDSSQPAAQALRAADTVTFDDLTTESIRATVRDDEHFELMSALDPRSAIAVPLVAQGEPLGAITFAFSESNRRYSPADIALAGEVARRAALAIDRSRLYRAEQTARLSAEAAQKRLEFLAESSAVLSSSLDYASTLKRVAELTVTSLADWCVIHMEEGGTVRQLELAHADPGKEELVADIQRRYPFDPSKPGPITQVLSTGEPILLPEIPDELLESSARDEDHLSLLQGAGMASAMIVPLVVHEHPIGALTLIASESGRRYGPADLALAEELARRSALAVENARLFREAEARANAALALERVADGVFLLDRHGVVRLWNPAAEAITGLPADRVVGLPAEDAIPGWADVVHLLPVAEAPGPTGSRPEAVPLAVNGRELWLSFSAVGFPDGTVYAFRDLTEERRLDELKTEFVATASHELRTPLAAVYGAAMTLRRKDLELDAQKRELLLSVIAEESDRLSRTINDLLWASRLDSGRIEMEIEPFDPIDCAERVLDAARTHAPGDIDLDLVVPSGSHRFVGDAAKLRQVLANLVENAIKYSPDGGRIELRIEPQGRFVRFAVADAGIGIPAREQARIFEKFYRLDPNLTRGVGGTGLGLYICRELVRHMGGHLRVASREGEGSTFFVELPLIDAPSAVSSA